MKAQKVISVIAAILVMGSFQQTGSPFPEEFEFGLIDGQPKSGKAKTAYYYFPARTAPETASLVIHLPGGPGVSSALGFMNRYGPFKVNDEGTNLTRTEKALNDKYNVLYLDLPYGSGFSKVGDEGDWVKNRTDMVDSWRDFWVKFIAKHPELEQRDIYVFGTSYGGHWVPYGARTLVELGYNVVGILIGNGWTSPLAAYATCTDFGWKMRQYSKMKQEEIEPSNERAALCHKLLTTSVAPYSLSRTQICEYLTFNAISKVAKQRNNCWSNYDIDTCRHNQSLPLIDRIENSLLSRNFEEIQNLKQTDPIAKFMNSEAVQTFLGNPGKFNTFSGRAYSEAEDVDNQAEATPDLEFLVSKGVKSLIFYGDMDWICNYANGEYTLDRMSWFGRSQWKEAELQECKYGLCKELFNLRYIRFRGAGHNTWTWNATASFEMFDEFVNWKI